ncbi:hypothetical protein SDC9_66243 [bioreactor metagenome]|uniref:Uncharacterized protein n=1 Tax=bioreactor metagenome TaxID=1076179 RepID=A0A644XV88_9ZZZZ
MWLVDCTRKKTALCDGSLGTNQFGRCFSGMDIHVVFTQKRHKLFRTFVHRHFSKIRFLRRLSNGLDDFIDEGDLGSDTSTIIRNIIQTFLDDFRKVLRQYFRCFRLINLRDRFTDLWNFLQQRFYL